MTLVDGDSTLPLEPPPPQALILSYLICSPQRVRPLFEIKAFEVLGMDVQLRQMKHSIASKQANAPSRAAAK